MRGEAQPRPYASILVALAVGRGVAATNRRAALGERAEYQSTASANSARAAERSRTRKLTAVAR